MRGVKQGGVGGGQRPQTVRRRVNQKQKDRGRGIRGKEVKQLACGANLKEEGANGRGVFGRKILQSSWVLQRYERRGEH